MNKKGLSPVIATVLLISIALVLAFIIFLWAKNFLAEQTQKNNQPIAMACKEINFDAEGTYDPAIREIAIHIVNRGNIPLYGVEVRKKSSSSVTGIGVLQSTIGKGEDGYAKVDEYDRAAGGETLVVLPMIIGKAGELQKRYTCDTMPVEVQI